MIPFLFFLVVAILGAVAYIYLRQEQAKVIPPNKYSEVQDEIYKKEQTTGKQLNRSFENPLPRFTLFLNTYILAMFVTLVVIAASPTPYVNAFLFVFLPLSIIQFPSGLIFFLTKQYVISQDILLTCIAVLIYLSIAFIASYIKIRWVFEFLYFVFIILLIMNIVGCSISAPIRMKIN